MGHKVVLISGPVLSLDLFLIAWQIGCGIHAIVTLLSFSIDRSQEASEDTPYNERADQEAQRIDHGDVLDPCLGVVEDVREEIAERV